MQKYIQQRGFTLVELMVALALGLVISAAAIMLFLTGQRGYALQQGMSNVQDNANFGLNYITRDIRATNLNNSTALINDEVKYSGIVFTSSANATTKTEDGVDVVYSNLPSTIEFNSSSENFLSSSGHPANVETSSSDDGESADVTSDQLVIQYIPQYKLKDTELFGGYDCEGNKLAFSTTQGRQVIVQRYFLKIDADTNKDSTEPNEPLSLFCDAGYYSVDAEPTEITNYGGDDDGQIIMKRVDHFRVLYGYIDAEDKFRYASAEDYMALSDSPKPRIVSIQLGVLARSTESVGNDRMFKDDQNYQILDQLVRVKDTDTNTSKYVRQVITQTVALRNSFGDRGQ